MQLNQLSDLVSGQSINIDSVEIYRIYNIYILFEIPEYGGDPQYINTYKSTDLNSLIDIVNNQLT